MKRTVIVLVCAVACLCAAARAQPLGTAFTYQGDLKSAGAPVNGTYDFRFLLFDNISVGSQIGSAQCADNVGVAGGRFAVQLDFGSQFAGQQRFLEIWVRPDTGLGCGNSTGFIILGPRQNLTATPNAAFSLTAGSAVSATTAGSATTATTATNATQLNGQAASFYTNAANLTAGTVPDARLATTVARTNVSQVFSAGNSFSSPPSFTVATGTSPFAVTSTTKVTNLNADALDGLDSTAFSLTGHNHAHGALTGLASDDHTQYYNQARGDARYARLNTFPGFTGVGLTSSAQLVLDAVGSSTGGTWMTTTNTSVGGRAWNLISSGSANTEGAGKFLVRDATGGGVRVAIDPAGNVGIGTSFPSAELEIYQQDPQLRLRNSNDTGGGVLVDTFGSLQLGMYNPTGAAWGSVPANGYRAVLALDTAGRVGSTTNTGAGPAFRNLLDDGNGRMSIGNTSPTTPLDLRGIGDQVAITQPANNEWRLRMGIDDVDGTGNGHGFITLRGRSGNSSVHLGRNVMEPGDHPNDGGIYVSKGDGNYCVKMFSQGGSGKGQLWSDVLVAYDSLNCYGFKLFRMPYPDRPGTEIAYACLEGPEVAAYVRGKAHLVGGHATITLPEHFTAIALEDTMTVQLTPRSRDSRGLAATEVTLAGVQVDELLQGTGDYEFDYVVTAVRRGFRNFEPVQPTLQSIDEKRTRADQAAREAAETVSGK